MPSRRERLEAVMRDPRLVDALYLGGVGLVVALAAYILAFG